MKRALARARSVTGLTGDVTGIWGEVTGLTGEVTGLTGDVTGLTGNVDMCEITDAARSDGIDVQTLIVDAQ